MRTILTLTITSLLVLAGCGTDSASSEPVAEPAAEAPVNPPPAPAEDGGYPDEAIDQLTSACVEQAGEEICGCVVDVVQAEVPYEDFDRMYAEMEQSATLPPELLNLILENCVGSDVS
ncbi:MAG: hypothetical protein AAFZ07_19340 [Actinomycetota bacterium]